MLNINTHTLVFVVGGISVLKSHKLHCKWGLNGIRDTHIFGIFSCIMYFHQFKNNLFAFLFAFSF